MGFIKEKVSYLKGLAEGMDINEGSKEGKMLLAMINVMDEMALFVEDIEEAQNEMGEHVIEIDEDLETVENAIFGKEGRKYCNCGCDCDCEESLHDVECPHCNEKFELEEDMIDDDNNFIECPHCHNCIDVEWESSDEDCKEEEI